MVSIVYSALVLLISFAHAVQSTRFVDVYINYREDPYIKGYKDVRRLLMKNEPPLYVGGHQFLAVRRPEFYGPPDKIIRIHLSGLEPDDRCIVAFAHDDMYAIGFTNRTGRWHCLAGFPFIIEGCIPLSFGDNYVEILGEGGHENLPLLPLGRQAAREAVGMLASHTAGPNEAAAKQGLGRLIVMLAEAQRILPIHKNLVANWEETTHMLPREAEYCVNWGRMSSFLLDWVRSGRKYWGKRDPEAAKELQDEAGISGPKDALKVVNALLRPYSN